MCAYRCLGRLQFLRLDIHGDASLRLARTTSKLKRDEGVERVKIEGEAFRVGHSLEDGLELSVQVWVRQIFIVKTRLRQEAAQEFVISDRLVGRKQTKKAVKFLAALLNERIAVDHVRRDVSGLLGQRWYGEAFVLIDLAQGGVKPLEVIKTAPHVIDFVLVIQVEQS